MSRREAWLSAGLVLVVALGVRIWAATQVTFPRPEDTAYYVDVARNVLAGHGLTADAIWSYNTPPLAFPRPAFEVWLPMASALDLIPMAIFGSSFAAAQLASILVGSIVAVLAWRLGADVAEDLSLSPERARTLAIGAGLAVSVYLPLVIFSVEPDSTMPFAAFVLAAVLVVRRIFRAVVVTPPPEAPRSPVPRRSGPSRPARRSPGVRDHDADQGGRPWPGVVLPGPHGLRLLGTLGLLIGLAALTRNDAVWLALVWAVVAWRATRPAGPLERRLLAAVPLVAIPALVAIAVYLPWFIRDAAVFGNPLPGQAALNALFLDGRDVFAWAEPPTLARYLNAGPLTLIGLRVTGFIHNVGSVLLGLGLPISALGLVGLPAAARVPALRPLIGFSLTTFLVATLVFPVATTWGTFLHAAGAIHVLVLISAVIVLDRLVERLRASRAWTRPVAWLGATAAVAASLLITVALVPAEAIAGQEVAARYAALPSAMAQAGAPLPTDGSPVITDFPIWLATETGVNTLALPNERPSEVVDLANQFGATLLVVDLGNEGIWPEILDEGLPGSECFKLVPLPGSGAAAGSGAGATNDALGDTLVYQIVCGPGQPGTP
ncbi:MAG TPA: hypothetical protein VF494_04545 [Candidatus Limnocylindrales bacterium]